VVNTTLLQEALFIYFLAKVLINVMHKLGMRFVKSDKEEFEYELWHPEHKRHLQDAIGSTPQ
jgi:hypothetical protein